MNWPWNYLIRCPFNTQKCSFNNSVYIQIFPASEKFFISTKELSPLLFITRIISHVHPKPKSCLPCSEKFFISITELSCYFTYIYITKGYLSCLSKTKEWSLIIYNKEFSPMFIQKLKNCLSTKGYLPCLSKTKELSLLLFITEFSPCSSKTKELYLFKGLSPMFIQN